MLGGQKFVSYTEVQSVVFQRHEQQFFASSIQKLADRQKKYLSDLGWYVENETLIFNI